MPVKRAFSQASPPREVAERIAERQKKRPAPFCMRLSDAERAALVAEAGSLPLGAHIKAKLFSSALPARRRGGLSLEDRAALAQVLALLGKSRIANNLNQLAYAANIGSLPMTPETETELRDTLAGVREMRALLMQALGMKPGGSS